MRQTLAVAARELRERWLLFPAGLFFGFAPLVLPAFGVPQDAAPVIGTVAALGLGLAAGLVAGASMLARDALDGRLAFLFSRPVPWAAIWGGKWLGALTLVVGSSILAALPWLLAHGPERYGGSWPAVLLDPEASTFFFALALLGIGLANFSSTAFRSRSSWVALDLGFLLLATWLVWRWVAPLFLLNAFGSQPLAGPWVPQVLLTPPAAALVLASAAQVIHGRIDLRRGHRALSLTFWGVIFLVLAGAGLRLAWVRAATPADLEQYAVGAHDPTGRWLYVEGLSRRGGGPQFLIDTEGQRYVPMGVLPLWQDPTMGMTFASDGRSGVVLVDGGEHSVLWSVDLAGDEPRFGEVELENSPRPTLGEKLALSSSGEHVLFANQHGASLFEVSTGRRVATATVPPGWRPVAARLLGEVSGRAWLMPSSGPRASTTTEIRLLEVAVGEEPRMTTVALAAPVDLVRGWPHLVHPDASGERFLTRDGGLHLRDGETGAIVATLLGERPGSALPFSGGPVPTGLFLADGRIVVAEAVEARTVLHVYDREGAPLDDITLERVAAGLGLGPEGDPDRVMVCFGYTLAGAGRSSGPESLVLDLDDRRVVETLPGQRPLGGFFWLDSPAHAPGAPAPTVHFLIGTDGAVVRRDFATGEERIVAGPGAPNLQRLTGP